MDGRKWVFEPDRVSGTVSDLLHSKTKRALVSLDSQLSLTEAIELKHNNISQAPVMDGTQLLGVLTETKLLHRALARGTVGEKVRELADLDFCVVHDHTEISVLTELFSRFEVALVYDDERQAKDIITRIDLIDFMARQRR